MAEGFFPFLILKCQNLHLRVLRDGRAQIDHLSIYKTGAGISLQPLTDGSGDLSDCSRPIQLHDNAIF